MANRFSRLIGDGTINSVEELKTAFKALAKQTHPDLAEGGAEVFVRVRRDYEAAMFELRASPARPHDRESPLDQERPPEHGQAAGAGEAEKALASLLKRGFPKQPRHEKERLRYNYARARLRSSFRAREDGTLALFDAFEKEMLAGSGAAGETALELLGAWSRAASLAPGPSRVAAMAALRFDLLRLSPTATLSPAAALSPTPEGGESGGLLSATCAALLDALVNGTERKARGWT
jgi:hypothetical protein